LYNLPVAMEHWVEINLEVDIAAQDGILLDVLRPYAQKLESRGELVTYHYFREPEIRFRLRLKNNSSRRNQERALARIASSLVRKKLVSEWHFGSHGEKGSKYAGEEDRYGKNGWRAAQNYFRDCSDIALILLDLRRRSKLESPLWAKGLGNPWEGGNTNPWREKEEDPLIYHWSRFVHLFSNQLGFNIEKEAELCAKQAENYRRVAREFGMRW
jgi:Lantibiotic biosynthesis dehydratase C-term